MADNSAHSEVLHLDIDVIRSPLCDSLPSVGGGASGNPPVRDPPGVPPRPFVPFIPSFPPTPAPERGSPVVKSAAAATPSSSSVSSFRLASTTRLAGRPKVLNTTVMRPPSTMPPGGFAQHPFDVAKTLKEVVHCRDEGVFLRVLPRAHLLNQLLLQESYAREMLVAQEAHLRLALQHRFAEERGKREEQALARRAKERLEELRRRHAEELAEQKRIAGDYAAALERGLRERLRPLAELQPRLNLLATVLAAVKDESGDLDLLAELLEEGKRLQKGLKTDQRFDKTATPELDGGALPYWLKHCLVASFNVAAIVKGAAYRAVVQDAPNVRSKLLSDRKIVVVRGAAGELHAWAHTRVALPDAETAAAGFLELAESDAGAPAECCQGVIWTKEDHANVVRAAKATGSPIVAASQRILSYGGIASVELTAKEVREIGEAAVV